MVFGPAKGVEPIDLGLVFCPGGGYGVLGLGPAVEMVEWITHLGGTVAILKYHVPRSKDDPNHRVPLSDAQRALSLLRSQAEKFNLSPSRIGIAGSSAGGHLAFHTSLSHEKRAYEAIDTVDQVSCRPDFSILFYPAYLGSNMKLSEKLDYTALNAKSTPPIYIMGASDDKHLTGTFAALPALKSSKISCEAHVFNHGGHGGMFAKYPMLEYARTCIRFLHRQGLVDKSLIAKTDIWLETKRQLAKPKKVEGKKSQIFSINAPSSISKSEYTEFEKDVELKVGYDIQVYRLWPNDGTRSDDPFKKDREELLERAVPIAKDITKPSMIFFPAAEPNGKAVMVFPGGGYSVLAYEHEGTKVAKWLNQLGISAFVVKYRTPRRNGLDKHHVALQDAQRAIRLVRAQAAQFGVDPNKIGSLGFSAGGHLTALTGKDFDKASYESVDAFDKVRFASDFNILIYPAYTTTKMFNDELDPHFIRNESEKMVPTFLATAIDDKFTHGMFYFLNEFHRRKVNAESHVYENGGHGKGINETEFSFSWWPVDCERWLSDLSL
jgi:acetyl esterase/lipase